MIVSHSKKFIFVKAYKVAGTSVQEALEKECGPGDLVIIDDHDPKTGLGQHSTPKEIRRFVGEDIWKEYLKIVIIRNPWDMFVSHYFFAHVSQKEFCPAYFSKFVWWNITGSCMLNDGFWLMDGKRWADEYIRFETLDMDCMRLFQKIGINFNGLDRIKSGFRPSIHYSIFYDKDTMNFIDKTYKKEILEFGYEFSHQFKKIGPGGDNTLWV